MANELPEGFTLDAPSISPNALPAGFKLDQSEKTLETPSAPKKDWTHPTIDPHQSLAATLKKMEEERVGGGTEAAMFRAAERGIAPGAVGVGTAGLLQSASLAALKAAGYIPPEGPGTIAKIGLSGVGLLGGALASYLAAKKQEEALEEHPDVAAALGQSKEQREADIAANPRLVTAAEAASNLAFGRPDLGVLRTLPGLTRAAGYGTIQGAINLGTQAYENHGTTKPIDWGQTAEAAGIGALFANPTEVGGKLWRNLNNIKPVVPVPKEALRLTGPEIPAGEPTGESYAGNVDRPTFSPPPDSAPAADLGEILPDLKPSTRPMPVTEPSALETHATSVGVEPVVETPPTRRTTPAKPARVGIRDFDIASPEQEAAAKQVKPGEVIPTTYGDFTVAANTRPNPDRPDRLIIGTHADGMEGTYTPSELATITKPKETLNVPTTEPSTGLVNPPVTTGAALPVPSGSPTESGVAGTEAGGLDVTQQLPTRTDVGTETQPTTLEQIEPVGGQPLQTTSWSPDRIDKLLRSYAAPHIPDYSKGYAAWVNPQEFLDATGYMGDYGKVLEEESTPLDKTRLTGETQPIYLDAKPIDPKNPENGFQIYGHEGRHRMIALRNAGVQSVPVVINRSDGIRNKSSVPLENVSFKGQKIQGKKSKGFSVDNLIPFSYANEDLLRSNFGHPADFQFSIGPSTPALPTTPRGPSKNQRALQLINEAQQGNVNPHLSAWLSATKSILSEPTPEPAPPARDIEQFQRQMLQGLRQGKMKPAEYDLANWLIQQNPDLVQGAALSISKAGINEGTTGVYKIVQDLIQLHPERSNDLRLVHEISHRAEQAMPPDIKQGIQDLWKKMFLEGLQSAYRSKDPNLIKYYNNLFEFHFTDPSVEDRPILHSEALDLIRDGKIGKEHYQFFDWHEFWAENSAKILQGKYAAEGSFLGRLRNWFSQLWAKLKNLFDLPSDHALLRAVNDMLHNKRGPKNPRENGAQAAQDLEQVRYKAPLDNAPRDPEDIIQDSMLSGKLEKKFPTINEIRELAHKGYETYIREFQNIYRPFKTRQNKMDLLGNLVVTGPKANDVYNIVSQMDSRANDIKNEHVVPAKEAVVEGLRKYVEQSGRSPENAYAAVNRFIHALAANPRRDELFRRYVPLRTNGKTVIEGKTYNDPPSAIRIQLFRRSGELAENTELPYEKITHLQNGIRKTLDALVANKDNLDPLGHSFHKNRPMDDEGNTIPMATNWDSSYYSPAGLTSPTAIVSPLLELMHEELDKYPALQETLDAFRRLTEVTKALKKQGGTYTDFVDHVVSRYGPQFEETYAPLIQDRAGEDPLDLSGTRHAGYVSGVTTGLEGGTHKTANVLDKAFELADRAAIEASRGGLTLRIKNFILANPDVGHYVTTIPASDIYWTAYSHESLPPELSGSNKIVHTLRNGAKEVFEIDDPHFLNALRRPNIVLGAIGRGYSRAMGAVASNFTHYRLAFAPWNFYKHSMMNAHVMSIRGDLVDGPTYISHLLQNMATAKGLDLLKFSKLFRTGNTAELERMAADEPFLRDTLEYLRKGGPAAFASLERAEHAGPTLLKQIKNNPYMRAKQAVSMVMNQWNDAWDWMSRVTAFGLQKRKILDRMGYADVVEEHGVDSPQAKNIMEEAVVRASNYAKELANFSLVGNKSRLMKMAYMFFGPAMTTNISTIDALSPMWTDVDAKINHTFTQEELAQPGVRENAKVEYNRLARNARIVSLSLVTAGALMYSLARAMSGKDEQGRNRIADTDKAMWIKQAQFEIPGTKKLLGTPLNANLAFGFGPGGLLAAGAQIAAFTYGDQTAAEAGGNLFNILVEMLSPIVPSHINPAKFFWSWLADTAVPWVAKVPLELAMNKNSIGKEIYNTHPSKYSPVYTGGANVPQGDADAALWAYKHLGVTVEPDMLNFLGSNLAQAPHDYANMAYGLVQAMRGKSDFDLKSLVGSFVSRVHTGDSQRYSEIKSQVAEAQQRLNTMDIDPRTGVELMKRHPMDSLIVESFNQNLGIIRELQQRRQEFQVMDIDPKNKRKLLNSIDVQLNLEKRLAVDSVKPLQVTP